MRPRWRSTTDAATFSLRSSRSFRRLKPKSWLARSGPAAAWGRRGFRSNKPLQRLAAHTQDLRLPSFLSTTISGDPEQSYFSDGIADDIITELSRFSELLVIARNSSFSFRGRSSDIRDTADRLGAQFIVEGSVRRVSNRIRVNVQLIEAASNAHIWADRYDRDLTDVFLIQDEITRMVVAQVAGHARSALARRNRSLAPAKLSAYDYLLRARQATSSLVSTLQSEPLLRKAIEIDPDLAIAHAILAHLTCIKFYYDGNTSHLADAIEIGQVALRLDPEEPWANYALAIAHMFSRRMRESRQFIDRALSLNSNEVNFLATDALWLTFMGEVEPALKAIDENFPSRPHRSRLVLGCPRDPARQHRKISRSARCAEPPDPDGTVESMLSRDLSSRPRKSGRSQGCG